MKNFNEMNVSNSPGLKNLSEGQRGVLLENFPQFKYFGRVAFVPGFFVRQALINAVHKKFNRSCDTFADLEQFMCSLYESLDEGYRFDLADPDITGGACEIGDEPDYCYAMYPVTFLQYHYHRGGVECERHVRVCFNYPGRFAIADIEEEYWEGFLAFEDEHLLPSAN